MMHVRACVRRGCPPDVISTAAKAMFPVRAKIARCDKQMSMNHGLTPVQCIKSVC
jgi:hypothetical protein